MKSRKLWRWKLFQYKGLLGIFCVFLLMGVLLLAERRGIRYQAESRASVYIKKEDTLRAQEVQETLPHTCLVLMNEENPGSCKMAEQWEQISLDMKVGYDLVDVAELSPGTEISYDPYETVVVMLSDLSPLEEQVLTLANWVKEGGNVLFTQSLERERYLMLLEQKLGVASAGYEHAMVDSIHPSEEFMVGGGKDYPLVDGFESAWAVQLGERAHVYAWTGGEKKVPLVWENDYGKGKFVVVNIGIYEKAMRGFYAAAYSLLTDCTAWPVINGAAFYLDDFPSPVPSGNGKYVLRDYGLSIKDFYTNIWWPDMLKLSDQYGVRYTGVIIENYEDATDGKVEKNEDTSRFQYFGNMLLRAGGEIGYHGYNHQPLCLDSTDYGEILPYKTWKSREAMEQAVEELIRFGDEIFPVGFKSVYVPASNVLSEEGREMLAEEFPQIRTIASNYFSGDLAYTQEFEVAEDGMVEQPRIISGCILDDYMRMCALSELNMHFVSNHFMHPDDLLDEDRGAKEGWETLKSNLDDYMNWLYTNAPSIRNLTGSELSGAIQRYAALSFTREITDQEVVFHIDHLYDEGFLMVRFNEGTPGNVTGGTLELLTGNLYLLKAESPEVHVELDR